MRYDTWTKKYDKCTIKAIYQADLAKSSTHPAVYRKKRGIVYERTVLSFLCLIHKECLKSW